MLLLSSSLRRRWISRVNYVRDRRYAWVTFRLERRQNKLATAMTITQNFVAVSVSLCNVTGFYDVNGSLVILDCQGET